MGDKIIGIDIGGTNLRVSLIENYKIKQYIKIRTPREKSAFISELFNLIDKIITNDVKGIGVASPGPLKDGIIQNPPNLKFLHNFNLKKALEQRFRKKVVLENDAKCVALAELYLGCKKNNFIILTLGTGVGGGIIINKKLYRGGGYAGELGHIILDNGEDFESLAASKALKRLTKEAFGRELLVNELLKMKNGTYNSLEKEPSERLRTSVRSFQVNTKEKARKILDEISMYLGQGIASLINIFDPEIVVIAGGIRETGSSFLNMIKKQVEKYSILPKKTKIEWSRLEHPGTLGASLLISENIK